jgi:hypothetical protein
MYRFAIVTNAGSNATDEVAEGDGMVGTDEETF